MLSFSEKWESNIMIVERILAERLKSANLLRFQPTYDGLNHCNFEVVVRVSETESFC